MAKMISDDYLKGWEQQLTIKPWFVVAHKTAATSNIQYYGW